MYELLASALLAFTVLSMLILLYLAWDNGREKR